MASDGRQMPQRRRALRVALLALAAAALILAAIAAPAGAEVVYDNPAAAGAEVPSLGFEETGTAELGSLLHLAGTARVDPTVRIAMAAPGESALVPITLNVYAAASGGVPGPLLARDTQTFEFASEPPPQPIEFSLAGLTLPDEVLVSVAFDAGAPKAGSLGVALAGPPATGASSREAEGIYRAATAEGVTSPFAFEAEPSAWQGRQPAFTIEATAPLATAAAPAAPVAVPRPPIRAYRREYFVPPSKRMTVEFPSAIARIAGPGALVQVRCTGSSAARCIGTLALSAAGTVHKAPFSIGKGRRQYVVVPLGSDRERLDGLDAVRATATASTVQLGGAAVRTKRTLKLK